MQKIWLNTLLILCFCALAGALIISLNIIGLEGDLSLYEASGNSVRPSEYPPLTTSIFVLLAHMPGISFVWSWSLLYVLLVIITVVYIRFTNSFAQLWHLPAALFVTVIAFGPDIMFARFDFIITLLLYLTWQSFVYKRYNHSAVFLVAAVFLKLIPVIIWPLLLIYTPRAHRLLVLKTSFVTALILLLIPFLVLGFQATVDNTAYMLSYHQDRGVSMESTWSSIHLLYRNLINEKAHIGFHHGAWHNNDLHYLANVFKILMIISLCIVIAWIAWTLKRTDFFLSMVLVLIVFYSTTPVFSPQFLIWVTPLIFIWWLQQSAFARLSFFSMLVIAITYAVAFVSLLVFPFLYRQIFAEQLLVPVSIMLLRQVLLVLLGVLIFFRLKHRPKIAYTKSS